MTLLDDIHAEIDSKQKIINNLKGQRRELEEQMAKFGSLYVPPYITQQVTDLTNQILQKEAELAQLRTQAVETSLPFVEVEYRALVAEAWNKSPGWLSIVDRTKLELERLRLGITEERSNEHHDWVRSRIAIETLLDLELNYIQGESDSRSSAVQRIIRAFRLDPHKTEEMLRQYIDAASAEILVEWLDITTTIWQNKNEYVDLDNLFQNLRREKQSHMLNTQILSIVSRKWVGEYSYGFGRSSRVITMTLIIEKSEKGEFIGQAEYPTLNTTTRVTGQILDQEVNNSATNKWGLIPDYSPDRANALIKFTESQYIHGNSTQLNGWYYGVIENNGQLIGIWYPRDTDTSPQASFQLNLS